MKASCLTDAYEQGKFFRKIALRNKILQNSEGYLQNVTNNQLYLKQKSSIPLSLLSSFPKYASNYVLTKTLQS